MPLSRCYFFIQFCMIYLFLKLARVNAIYGHEREAGEHEFPFVAALKEMNHVPPYVFCTGALITKKHVLTANHCMESVSLDNIRHLRTVSVLVGSSDHNKCYAYKPEETWHSYDQWHYYKTGIWDNSEDHDIAVLTLKREVHHTHAQPAVVSHFERRDIIGSEVKLVGWGLINGDHRPDVLRKANVRVVTQQVSETRIHELTNTHCPQQEWDINTESTPWSLSGFGDSGGPLLNNRNEIIGITIGTCPNDESIPNDIASRARRLNQHLGFYYRSYREFIHQFQ